MIATRTRAHSLAVKPNAKKLLCAIEDFRLPFGLLKQTKHSLFPFFPHRLKNLEKMFPIKQGIPVLTGFGFFRQNAFYLVAS